MAVLSEINIPITPSMAFFCKSVFLFVLLSFLNFATNRALDPNFLYQVCSETKFTAYSPYQGDLRTLLSSLSSNATKNTEFYNTTIANRNPSDRVYGLFMCRGDVPSQLCGQCVGNATQRLSTHPECTLAVEAVMWYDECMVRYSDQYFFSTVDLGPGYVLSNSVNMSNQASFMRLLFDIMNKTADEAANAPIGAKKYATKQASMSQFINLYSLAQCTEDLSPQDCRTCLTYAIKWDLPRCCGGKQGGRVLYPSCNVRYELYPFYLSPAPPPTPTSSGLAPSTDFSKDPAGYLSHNCSSNEIFSPNSTFQSNLRTLLSSLSFIASGNTEFYNTTIAGRSPQDTVYGLFMCRGDVSPRLCGQCVLNATERISSECGLSKEAIIWYNHCLLRYSYRSFFSAVDKSPRFVELNTTNSSNLNQQQNYFTSTLSDTLSQVATEAGNSFKKYATKSVELNVFQTLYTLAQCTRDLSIQDCDNCLIDMIQFAIPWCCLASPEGKILYPSCYLRFELSKFYSDGDESGALGPASPQPPPPPGPTESRKVRLRTIVLIVVPAIVSAMLFCFGCYLLRRKARKGNKTILMENFGHETTSLEPLQFDLAVIQAATNNFSQENRIGKGGFGEVYKGILLDGRQIAVKRLSKSSGQGAVEFKNEILLIARLQHKNLVALIGFCLEEQEKILVYEYVPNRSLDYFLFGSQPQQLLNWFERYKIIKGIGRGILYLHQYSRLKIIHRDLKPSNVLLDENLNPKISDFGMARIVAIDEAQRSTERIVGTYGYMSPEYAMFGQFSEKSDIFSFGVIVLEIITGTRNLRSFESNRIADGLLSYVWRQWKNQTPLSILDPNLKELYYQPEVMKCIQIGLLCVQKNPDARPTMVTVVSYLSNYSIELPFPQEPAFFMHGRMDPREVAQESSSSLSINNSTAFSINEMSLSEFLPR